MKVAAVQLAIEDCQGMQAAVQAGPSPWPCKCEAYKQWVYSGVNWLFTALWAVYGLYGFLASFPIKAVNNKSINKQLERNKFRF